MTGRYGKGHDGVRIDGAAAPDCPECGDTGISYRGDDGGHDHMNARICDHGGSGRGAGPQVDAVCFCCGGPLDGKALWNPEMYCAPCDAQRVIRISLQLNAIVARRDARGIGICDHTTPYTRAEVIARARGQG